MTRGQVTGLMVGIFSTLVLIIVTVPAATAMANIESWASLFGNPTVSQYAHAVVGWLETPYSTLEKDQSGPLQWISAFLAGVGMLLGFYNALSKRWRAGQ